MPIVKIATTIVRSFVQAGQGSWPSRVWGLDGAFSRGDENIKRSFSFSICTNMRCLVGVSLVLGRCDRFQRLNPATAGLAPTG